MVTKKNNWYAIVDENDSLIMLDPPIFVFHKENIERNNRNFFYSREEARGRKRRLTLLYPEMKFKIAKLDINIEKIVR